MDPIPFSLRLNDIVDFVSEFAVICYANYITLIVPDKEIDVEYYSKTDVNLKIANKSINSTDSAFSLEMISTFSWNTYCQQVINKLNRPIFKLRSLRTIVELSTLNFKIA